MAGTAQADKVRLTKGQREFLDAVRAGSNRQFHRMVIEPVEALGLVKFTGGLRLVGRNAYPATYFGEV